MVENNKDVLKAICPLPWISVSFNTDSSFRVCCNTSHGGQIMEKDKKIYLKDVTGYSQVQQAETVRGLKEKMLAGERSRFCSSCYEVEDAGGFSIRQSNVLKYDEVVKKVIANKTPEQLEKIRFLDFSLSNNCNLKCRMCTPGASYLLQADFDKAGLPYDKDYSDLAHKSWKYEDAIENLILNESEALTDILFTGGEPLTNQIHLKVLLALIENDRAKDITLSYHSNLMVLPDQILQAWTNFKEVQVHLSLEGYEKYNDYIRYNSKFEKIVENLETLISLKHKINLWIEIHTVFQAYNLQIIPQYLTYLKRFAADIPPFPHFIWIDNPSFLSANSLPESLKRDAVNAINRYLEENSDYFKDTKFQNFLSEKILTLKSCLNRIEYSNNDEKRNEFVNYTRKLDKLRNQNVEEIFPRWHEVAGENGR